MVWGESRGGSINLTSTYKTFSLTLFKGGEEIWLTIRWLSMSVQILPQTPQQNELTVRVQAKIILDYV